MGILDTLKKNKSLTGAQLSGAGPVLSETGEAAVPGTAKAKEFIAKKTPLLPTSVTSKSLATPKDQFIDSKLSQSQMVESPKAPPTPTPIADEPSVQSPEVAKMLADADASRTAPPSATPTPAEQEDPRASYKKAYSDYISSLSSSGDVESAKTKYLDFVQSRDTGLQNISDRVQPLSFQTGQQASLRNQAEIQGRRLQGDVELAQGRQTQDQTARKGLLDFEKSLLPGDADTVTLSPGQTVFDPSTGEAIFTAPAEDGTTARKTVTLSPGQQIVDPATGKVIYTAPPKGGDESDLADEERLQNQLQNSIDVMGKIDQAIGKVGFGSTGFLGQVTGGIGGTEAHDLSGTISTIQANLAFDRLQAMREASKTGGALGQISERELLLLQSAVENLDPTQKTETVISNLQDVSDKYQRMVDKLNIALGTQGKGDDLDNALDEMGFSGVGGDTNTALKVSYPTGEVKQGGSAAWRNNNPLNIKFGNFAKGYDAFKGSKATDGGDFAAFKNSETGLKAARDLLRSKNYINLSLEKAMRRWSGNGYGADVAPSLKGKTTGQMTNSELDQLIKSMSRREGWTEGKTYA